MSSQAGPSLLGHVRAEREDNDGYAVIETATEGRETPWGPSAVTGGRWPRLAGVDGRSRNYRAVPKQQEAGARLTRTSPPRGRERNDDDRPRLSESATEHREALLPGRLISTAGHSRRPTSVSESMPRRRRRRRSGTSSLGRPPLVGSGGIRDMSGGCRTLPVLGNWSDDLQ